MQEPPRRHSLRCRCHVLGPRLSRQSLPHWRLPGGRGRVLLADGSESVCDIFAATVMWDGTRRRIAVDAADTPPLIGMALLHGYELTVRVVHGGDVHITALP